MIHGLGTVIIVIIVGTIVASTTAATSTAAPSFAAHALRGQWSDTTTHAHSHKNTFFLEKQRRRKKNSNLFRLLCAFFPEVHIFSYSFILHKKESKFTRVSKKIYLYCCSDKFIHGKSRKSKSLIYFFQVSITAKYLIPPLCGHIDMMHITK